MGALLKLLGPYLSSEAFSGQKGAKLIVRLARTGYVANGGIIILLWYAAYRNERVEPGKIDFPVPGLTKLKRKFTADRPEKELEHVPAIGVTPSDLGFKEPSHSAFQSAGVLGDGSKLLKQHPELKPGIARVVEAVMQHFPSLVITATTNGTHVEGSYHYKGRAVDLAGPRHVMQVAAQWINQNFSGLLTEGIHNPGLSVKNKQHVPSSFWDAETWAAHENHIHLAV